MPWTNWSTAAWTPCSIRRDWKGAPSSTAVRWPRSGATTWTSGFTRSSTAPLAISSNWWPTATTPCASWPRAVTRRGSGLFPPVRSALSGEARSQSGVTAGSPTSFSTTPSFTWARTIIPRPRCWDACSAPGGSTFSTRRCAGSGFESSRSCWRVTSPTGSSWTSHWTTSSAPSAVSARWLNWLRS